VTDGPGSYHGDSAGRAACERVVQTKPQRRESDALQVCHGTILLLKRWLLGTHAGAVIPKHLQAYLDEVAFRHNGRKTNGVERIAARVIERLVAHAITDRRHEGLPVVQIRSTGSSKGDKHAGRAGRSPHRKQGEAQNKAHATFFRYFRRLVLRIKRSNLAATNAYTSAL
jgi:hypothetical protein